MVSFGDLIRLQKSLPRECPIRLIPFVNDPLAFVGEEGLDEKVETLKGMVQRCSGEDASTREVINKINENLGLIHEAEIRLSELKKEAEGIFEGYECTANSALYQTEKDISNTLWVEAFKQIDGIELVFQLHTSLDLKVVWARVSVLVGKPNETVVKLLKIHDGKGWRYSELTGPENRCYLLEKIIGTRDTVKEVMGEGLGVMNGINEELGKSG